MELNCDDIDHESKNIKVKEKFIKSLTIDPFCYLKNINEQQSILLNNKTENTVKYSLIQSQLKRGKNTRSTLFNLSDLDSNSTNINLNVNQLHL